MQNKRQNNKKVINKRKNNKKFNLNPNQVSSIAISDVMTQDEKRKFLTYVWYMTEDEKKELMRLI